MLNLPLPPLWLLLHRHTRPHFQPINHPLRIRIFQNPRLANPVTLFAALMVDPSVIAGVGVQADGDGDVSADPAFGGAGWVEAVEVAEDGCVVFFEAG